MPNPGKGEQVFTNCTTGGPVYVYVKDGKITGIEPLELSPEDAESWVIKAHGKEFSPPRIARVSPYTLSERSRIYGNNRILYPMVREDFKLDGDRNFGNRGVSGYRRIGWDEALDILTEEIRRVIFNYGPGTIFTMPSSHHNWGNIGYLFSAYLRFMSVLGCTHDMHNPDSWEGWFWGSTHHWGYSWRLGVSG